MPSEVELEEALSPRLLVLACMDELVVSASVELVLSACVDDVLCDEDELDPTRAEYSS